MERVRIVPGQNAISDTSGEDIPTGPEPDYAEATPDVREGDRPETDVGAELLLETKPVD